MLGKSKWANTNLWLVNPSPPNFLYFGIYRSWKQHLPLVDIFIQSKDIRGQIRKLFENARTVDAG